MELTEIRKEINKVNDEMLKLFEKRMALCKEVALYKKENNMEIFVKSREDEILKEIKEKSSKGLESYNEEFFKTLMALSRDYQKTVTEE